MNRTFVINIIAAIAAILVPPILGTVGTQQTDLLFAQEMMAAGPNDPSLQAYADKERTCIEWTDSCRTCQRVGNAVLCPNIGIACQPKAIACVRREEPPKPAEPAKPAEPPKQEPPKQ